MAGLNKPGMEEEKNEERDTRGKRCTRWRRGEHEHENDVREQRKRRGGGGWENVQWVSHHGGHVQICTFVSGERKRESKSLTQLCVFEGREKDYRG